MALDVRAAVIDLDDIEQMLPAAGPNAHVATWTMARRASGTLANAFLADGVSVIIADGSYNQAIDRAIFERQLDTDIRPFYVSLGVTYEEAIRRAQGDQTRGVSRPGGERLAGGQVRSDSGDVMLEDGLEIELIRGPGSPAPLPSS